MPDQNEEKVHVRFVKTYTVKDKTGTTYHEGEEHEFPPRSAEHFVRKGVAEYVGGRKPESAKTMVKAAPAKAEAEPAKQADGKEAKIEKSNPPDALGKDDIKKAK